MLKAFRPLLIVAALAMIVGWLEMPRRAFNAPMPDSVKRLLETQQLLGQTAPAQGIPVNPSALYGAAIVYSATTTGGGAVTLTAPSKAIGANQRLYIYGAWCINSSSTATVVATLKDTAASPVTYDYIPCPANSVFAPVAFNPPIAITMGKQPSMTASTGVSTLYYHVSGYFDLN